MRDIIDKIAVNLALYDIRTLIAKSGELFIINKRRYADYSIGTIPDQLLAVDGDTALIPLQECSAKRGGKTIYYLVHCFYPFSQGGTERFIYNMALQAKSDGNHVKVITYNALKSRSHFKNKIGGILFNEYQIDGLDVVEYRHKRAPRGILKDIIADDQEVHEFAQFLFKRERPDIVHAGYIQKVSSFLAACRKNGIPYGITLTSFYSVCHYDIMIDGKGGLCSGSDKGAKCRRVCGCLDVRDTFKRYSTMHELLQDAAFLAAPSIFVKQMVEKEFADIDIQVINHGVSREFMTTSVGTMVNREKIRNFAYLGTLSLIKGVHGLITAFKELPSEFHLNIYGSGDEAYIRKIRKLIRGRDNISLCGSVKYNEISKAYADNDVIIVPSIWYETYNFVIHEALLMNRIVIAARIGAMPERIKDGINGFTFTPGDWSDLRKSLYKALHMDLKPDDGGSEKINAVESEFDQYNRLYR
ncbi:MAG: glycosyltransferase [Syntrophomonas sp.]